MNVRNRVEGQATQHVGGVVSLPEGGRPVRVFMRHQREEQDGERENKVGQVGFRPE